MVHSRDGKGMRCRTKNGSRGIEGFLDSWIPGFLEKSGEVGMCSAKGALSSATVTAVDGDSMARRGSVGEGGSGPCRTLQRSTRWTLDDGQWANGIDNTQR